MRVTSGRLHLCRLIRSAGNAKSMDETRAVHARVEEFGLDRYLANLLVEAYGKCRMLDDARSLFARIHRPNIFSWNILLEANAHGGDLHETKHLFDRLPERDVWTWTKLLVAFSHTVYADEIFQRMPGRDCVSWNAMISTHAGRFQQARLHFEETPCPTIVSWTAMLEACSKVEDLVDLEVLFDRMPSKDNVSWIVVMAAFARRGDLDRASKIFQLMPQHNVNCCNTLITAHLNFEGGASTVVEDILAGMPETNLVSWNTMLSSYARQGDTRQLEKLFEEMSERNAITWDIALSGHARHGSLARTLATFRKMPGHTSASWMLVMTAQATSGHLDEVKLLFDDIPQADIIAWNTLMFSYARHAIAADESSKKNMIAAVESTFVRMPALDVVSYNVLLALYARNGRMSEAWRLFEEISQRDAVSWGTLVSACVSGGDIAAANLVLARMPRHSTVAQNSVLAGYAQTGNVQEAKAWFDAMPSKDSVSWNSLIAAYAKSNSICDQRTAVDLFIGMDLAGLPLNIVSCLNVLEACTKLADVGLAQAMHASISGLRAFGGNSSCRDCVAVQNALINMYAKCGCMTEASAIFVNLRQNLRETNVSWNCIIVANAAAGYNKEALHALWNLVIEGWRADELAFIGALVACGRMGCVLTACELFVSMSSDYGVPAAVTHYLCMADVLSRAGFVEDAKELLQKMPFEPDAVGWRTLLAASFTQGNGDIALDFAISAAMEKNADSFPYVQLSNIYMQYSL